MTTPRKRAHEEDENEEDASPSLWNSFFGGLFSTAKKKPKRQRTAEEAWTLETATQMPRLNLKSPFAHASPPAETTGTPPASLTPAATAPARTPSLPPARTTAAPSPWQAPPYQYTPGPLV